MPAETVSPSPPRCWARTQCVMAPIGKCLLRTGLMPTGKTEETDTMFCFARPAFWRAWSKAFRSERRETALPAVRKNLVGIGGMVACEAPGMAGATLGFGEPARVYRR